MNDEQDKPRDYNADPLRIGCCALHMPLWMIGVYAVAIVLAVIGDAIMKEPR